MASSRFQLVAILVIFSLVITAQAHSAEKEVMEKEVMDGPCRLRGTCNADSDCDKLCHRSTDAVPMDGHCMFDHPTGPVCCCLFD